MSIIRPTNENRKVFKFFIPKSHLFLKLQSVLSQNIKKKIKLFRYSKKLKILILISKNKNITGKKEWKSI